MHKVFLSYSFRNENDGLLAATRAIVEAAGFRVEDGKVLGQLEVSAGVQAKIDACQGVVCVVTPEAHATGWVPAELNRALGAQKRLCILRHESVDLGAPLQGMSTAVFADDDPYAAISYLAGTLGLWKERLGNPMRAVLLPTELGRDAYARNATCEYRCEELLSSTESEWKKARLKPIDAAIHAILPAVPHNHSVQVRLTFTDRIWTSDFIPQHLRLQFQ